MLAELDKLFMPKQESALAKQEFIEYKQHPDEPSLTYFSTKQALYDRGYSDQTDLTFLLQSTQNGLASKHVKRKLLDVAHQFTTYEKLRDCTMTNISAQRTAIQDGLSYDTCMDGLNSTTPYYQAQQGYPGAPKAEAAGAHSVQTARAYAPWAAPETLNQWGTQAPARIQGGQAGPMQYRQCLPPL
ncbi:MAG: hypothetical protein GY696_14280 [Gammaproteobacteria bacterium]|nr:hypothetical protein [Gammaproteobacteria bacterium]